MLSSAAIGFSLSFSSIPLPLRAHAHKLAYPKSLKDASYPFAWLRLLNRICVTRRFTINLNMFPGLPVSSLRAVRFLLSIFLCTSAAHFSSFSSHLHLNSALSICFLTARSILCTSSSMRVIRIFTSQRLSFIILLFSYLSCIALVFFCAIFEHLKCNFLILRVTLNPLFVRAF